MRVLGIDATLQRCSVALLVDGEVVESRVSDAARGQHHLLPRMAADLLQSDSTLDGVAVTIGPGSFTGLRASISLAHGLAAGRCPVLGVTIAEALAQQAGDVGGRALWTAIDSRRGRIFLDRDGSFAAMEISDVWPTAAKVAICGDAAVALVAQLAATGADVMLTRARQPHAADVALVGAAMLEGRMAPHEAQPLYVDPPEAKLPAGGLRPPPVG